MAGGERHPDLAIWLHAADPWPVAGARVDDDNWGFRQIDRGAVRRDYANEPVIDRPFQCAAVPHQFGGKIEHMRNLLRRMLAIAVCSLAQRVENQHGALPRVGPVLLHRVETPSFVGHRLPFARPLTSPFTRL